MVERHCYFAAKSPEVEIRDDHIFILPAGCPAEIALTARTLQTFVRRANRILDEWEARKAEVVPLKGFAESFRAKGKPAK